LALAVVGAFVRSFVRLFVCSFVRRRRRLFVVCCCCCCCCCCWLRIGCWLLVASCRWLFRQVFVCKRDIKLECSGCRVLRRKWLCLCFWPLFVFVLCVVRAFSWFGASLLCSAASGLWGRCVGACASWSFSVLCSLDSGHSSVRQRDFSGCHGS